MKIRYKNYTLYIGKCLTAKKWGLRVYPYARLNSKQKLEVAKGRTLMVFGINLGGKFEIHLSKTIC